jgi:hypothetical protein
VVAIAIATKEDRLWISISSEQEGQIGRERDSMTGQAMK